MNTATIPHKGTYRYRTIEGSQAIAWLLAVRDEWESYVGYPQTAQHLVTLMAEALGGKVWPIAMSRERCGMRDARRDPGLPAEKLVDDELCKGDPRSMEYRQGVLDAVRFRLGGIPIPRRYPVGTAQADAYFAGIERGHALWRMRQKRPEAGREERL